MNSVKQKSGSVEQKISSHDWQLEILEHKHPPPALIEMPRSAINSFPPRTWIPQSACNVKGSKLKTGRITYIWHNRCGQKRQSSHLKKQSPGLSNRLNVEVNESSGSVPLKISTGSMSDGRPHNVKRIAEILLFKWCQYHHISENKMAFPDLSLITTENSGPGQEGNCYDLSRKREKRDNVFGSSPLFFHIQIDSQLCPEHLSSLLNAHFWEHGINTRQNHWLL